MELETRNLECRLRLEQSPSARPVVPVHRSDPWCWFPQALSRALCSVPDLACGPILFTCRAPCESGHLVAGEQLLILPLLLSLNFQTYEKPCGLDDVAPQVGFCQ